MNTIKKHEIKNELKYKNTVVLTYRIEYPEITSSNYCYGKNIFNKYNKDKAIMLENYIKNKLYFDAVSTYEYNSANGYPIMVFEVISEFNITYNNGFLISLYEDKYEFTGGAHGNTIRTSQNWNLSTGCFIPLSYFFPNNPYYLVNIFKNINSQIQTNPENYFDNYCELVLETFNPESFYVTSENIAIYFQQYDIAPYSSGIPVFYINIKGSAI
jgi:hypothetical protein